MQGTWLIDSKDLATFYQLDIEQAYKYYTITYCPAKSECRVFIGFFGSKSERSDLDWKFNKRLDFRGKVSPMCSLTKAFRHLRFLCGDLRDFNVEEQTQDTYLELH